MMVYEKGIAFILVKSETWSLFLMFKIVDYMCIKKTCKSFRMHAQPAVVTKSHGLTEDPTLILLP